MRARRTVRAVALCHCVPYALCALCTMCTHSAPGAHGAYRAYSPAGRAVRCCAPVLCPTTRTLKNKKNTTPNHVHGGQKTLKKQKKRFLTKNRRPVERLAHPLPNPLPHHCPNALSPQSCPLHCTMAEAQVWSHSVPHINSSPQEEGHCSSAVLDNSIKRGACTVARNAHGTTMPTGQQPWRRMCSSAHFCGHGAGSVCTVLLLRPFATTV